MTRELIWRWVTPRWRRHLERLVERERPDAVVVFTVPMAHLRGIPTTLRERFGVPVVFYDGDVPMSLPEFGGMDTGFNWYHDADPSRVRRSSLSNSEGGLERLRELGARRAEAVFWGADPEFFAPQPVDKELDVFFYGYGDKFRRDWMRGDGRRAVAARCPTSTSRSAAATSAATPALRRLRRRRAVQRLRARDLRGAHQPLHHAPLARDASTPRPRAARSSSPSAGAAIVSNPYDGIERWFEPGSELLVVNDADEATSAYPRPARRPGAGRGDGSSSARARARRAHVSSPRAPAARR